MTDKERISMEIVRRIIPQLTYCCQSLKEKEKIVKSCIQDTSQLKKGDLVFANTTITPNDFTVGFIERIEHDCVVIREIGSTRCTNYYNESFTKINKELLGYEILEGNCYKVYQKVLKAFESTGYWTRFKSISFDGDMCIVQARKAFSDTFLFEISFPMNSSIKKITNILKAEEQKIS